jgi:hypothetical protein
MQPADAAPMDPPEALRPSLLVADGWQGVQTEIKPLNA